MIQYLPDGRFKWLRKKKVDEFHLNLVKEHSSTGYILKVDLEYPSELHDLHNDYPLAPERLEISQNMLPKYCSDIADKYGIKIGGVNKLVPNLGNKKKYVVHYRNLQFYLSLGMKLSKIHGILKFKQCEWLKKFVDFSTDKRKNAANKFEESFFKLTINSVFGKTMENLRKRICVKLINNAKDYAICVSRSSFVSQKIFDKNFVAVHKIKPALKLNQPNYVGFSILELSKSLMYEFHYKYINNKYDAKLLFTDTHSLVYEIKTKDVYDDYPLAPERLEISQNMLPKYCSDIADIGGVNKLVPNLRNKKNMSFITEIFNFICH